jgi:hypothetical protein
MIQEVQKCIEIAMDPAVKGLLSTLPGNKDGDGINGDTAPIADFDASDLAKLKGILLNFEQLVLAEPLQGQGQPPGSGYTRDGYYIFELLNKVKVNDYRCLITTVTISVT